MPVTLVIRRPLENDDMQRVATFSRIIRVVLDQDPWWTEERMLRLLALPALQRLTTVDARYRHATQWLSKPPVQTALLSLPELQSLEMIASPAAPLLSSAVALASRLSSLTVDVVDGDPMAAVGSFSAMRLFPALTSFHWYSEEQVMAADVHREIIACLPSTIRTLNLAQLLMSRETIEELFRRTPLLQSFQFDAASSVAVLSMLDSGAAALPELRALRMSGFATEQFVRQMRLDPMYRLLRRFMHRFPLVHVRFDVADSLWEDESEERAMKAFTRRYVGWPRLEKYTVDDDELIE